jgi:hypothetical protein
MDRSRVVGTSSDGNDVRGLAGWFPPSQEQLERWLAGHVERVDSRGSTALRPSVAALNDLIDSDLVVGMLVARMVEQVPQGRNYSQRHVRDVDHLLAMIDGVLDIAPKYRRTPPRPTRPTPGERTPAASRTARPPAQPGPRARRGRRP